jgi:glycogen debranching enzyme
MKKAVGRIFTGLFDAASYMDLRRLPELFCGFRRSHERGPTLYPVACTPQAWASVTPFSLLQSCLGLELDPFAKEIRLRNPYLPPFIERIFIRNLRVGTASTDLAIHQQHGKVSVELIATSGFLRLVVTST